MIIPANRLLFWVAALLPFAMVGALVPACALLCAMPFALLFVVACFDAVSARARTAAIRVAAPDVVRLIMQRRGIVPLTISSAAPAVRRLFLGLSLSSSFKSDQDVMDVLLPEGSTRCAVPWPCTPEERGNFLMTRCHFAILSPLGFWHARSASRCRTEIRVYPNLMTEKKRLAALFLKRGPFGIHRQRMIGQGREFEKLREYIPGDSFDDIHWKATAKRGRPVTKLYQIERTQEIYAVIDASRLSARAAGAEPVLERYITSALVLGLAAEQQNDLFGLTAFGSKVARFIRASSGRPHFNMCRDALYSIQPQIATPDYDELCAFIRLRLRRRALLMILTDLSDPMLAESFVRNIELICRQHVVMVTMIRQPGIEPLFSSPDAEGTDQLYRKLGGHMTWQNIRELEKTLQHRGVRLSLADNEKLSAELVTQYMSVKARQIL